VNRNQVYVLYENKQSERKQTKVVSLFQLFTHVTRALYIMWHRSQLLQEYFAGCTKVKTGSGVWDRMVVWWLVVGVCFWQVVGNFGYLNLFPHQRCGTWV